MVLVLVLVVVLAVLLAATALVVSTRSRRQRNAVAGSSASRPPTGTLLLEQQTAQPSPDTVDSDLRELAERDLAEGEAAEQLRAGRPALGDRLGKARQLLGGYLTGIRSKPVDGATFDELEEALLLADAGVTTTTKVLEDLRAKVRSGAVAGTPEALLAALRRTASHSRCASWSR